MRNHTFIVRKRISAGFSAQGHPALIFLMPIIQLVILAHAADFEAVKNINLRRRSRPESVSRQLIL